MMRLCGSIVVLLALGSVAEAQYSQPPPPPGYGPPGYGPPPPGYYTAPPPPPVGVVRDGFTVGFSLGLGSIVDGDCDTCESADGVAVDLHLGGMLTPRLALLLDLSTVVHTDEEQFGEDYSLMHSITAVALQYWVSDRVWLRAGLGVGRLTARYQDQEVESDPGGAFVGAAGFEIMQRQSFTLDLQAGLAIVGYGTEDQEQVTLMNFGLSLGLNWY